MNVARGTRYIAIGLLLALASCGGGEEEILVSAAASLTDAFRVAEAQYEASHDGVDVIVNLGGSSALREQIRSGAPADVFASANRDNMDEIVAAGLAEGEPQVFASNQLAIAVPAGNPGGVAGLDDFARDELLIGLCAAGVPCGDFARKLLNAAGVTAAPDTEEPDVRALLTKLEEGELDAGIVYVTDAMAAGDAVETIEIEAGDNEVALYPIVALANAPNGPGAADFVAFIMSDEGQAIMAHFGFGTA